MRTLIDANQTPLRIHWIQGRDAYDGMLEGTPYLARKFRLMRARTAMQQPGLLVVGLSELESELEELDPQTTAWAPNEEWTARLVSEADWRTKTRRYVVLMWFQSGGDPMERLVVWVRNLE